MVARAEEEKGGKEIGSRGHRAATCFFASNVFWHFVPSSTGESFDLVCQNMFGSFQKARYHYSRAVCAEVCDVVGTVEQGFWLRQMGIEARLKVWLLVQWFNSLLTAGDIARRTNVGCVHLVPTAGIFM